MSAQVCSNFFIFYSILAAQKVAQAANSLEDFHLLTYVFYIDKWNNLNSLFSKKDFNALLHVYL